MENNPQIPQILLCIPNQTIRKNYTGQIIPPETSAEILEAPDIDTAIDLIQKDTDHRIKAVIMGLFEEIEETLIIITAIKQSLRPTIETIFIYDPTQRNKEQVTHKDFLDQTESISTDAIDFTLPYPINIPEIRKILATALLKKATTTRP